MIRDLNQVGLAGRTITPGTVNIVLPPSKYDAILTILGDPNLVTGNVKYGATIFNVPGKSSVVDTSDATATVAEILLNDTAYVNGSKVTGTMPDKGAVVLTPSGTATVPIPAGAHNGAGYVQQVSVPSIKVQNDTTIAGVTGTMPEASYSSPVMPGTTQQQIAAGHHTGAGNDAVAGDPNHIAANIKAGITDLGVTGTYNGLKSVQYGTITIPSSYPSPNTATTAISSVTAANAVVVPLGWYSTNSNTNDPKDSPILSLTNSTTVTATKTGNTGFTTYVNFMVIEFSNLKSNQKGTIALIGSSSTATISTVNMAKALCFTTGYTGGGGLGDDMMMITLTNSTTVTATSTRAINSPQIGYAVAEFY